MRLKHWLIVAASHSAVLLWERWLGRTERVVAGSTIDLILGLLGRILRAILKIKKGK